jgi:hypothetical protein
VIATLGSGQHYLVDLVVSLPFALAVQSVASYALPSKSRRIAAMVYGLGFTMAWLLLVRFGVSWALESPVIPWTLIIATTSITVWLESWMSKRNSTSRIYRSPKMIDNKMVPAATDPGS